ncbi:MAG TPA: TonB-dependent receptor [Terriglobales bacterium]|jgi:outer membrane receptor protein involved in Fe transport|nr:TonB-dependent receptor [Terriglobales bacterium]
MRLIRIPLLGGLILLAVGASATIFGSVTGLIHDPAHRPVAGAQVTLRAVSSEWTKTTSSDNSGEFRFDAVPLGEYQVTVEVSGFAGQEQKLVLTSGRDARLHFALTVAQAEETVEVMDTAATVNPESSTTSAVVSREQIAQTPGADQTNSLAMITNYTPSAYMVHDQLHIRGGHQVSWLLDGVPVPNTNIASNVGPQFDPKDIDYIEVQRGGYNAEYGDRTYGVFNVVTRSGFERNRQAEVVASYGSYNNTNDEISFGDHTERFAYYGSLSGYRTDLGLETPITRVVHDQAAGLGGFASLIFNKSPTDQLRLITSVRGDHYQVPEDPNASVSDGFVGIGDVEDERDTLVNFTWLHTAGPGLVLTISPFYHFNRAHYIGGPLDQPVNPEDDRGSNYVGGVVSLAWTQHRHTLRTGIQAFGQRDNELFAIASNDPTLALAPQRRIPWGSVATYFLEDQFKLTSWLTLNGGVRLTHFEAGVSENAADPRIGAAVRIPRLNWVARAFYGRYYQAPPLLTVGGPLIDLCSQQDCGFLPLHGERDEQHEFGLTIPFAGWTFDVANFRTGARNFFDHDVLGNSNIFFPLTLERARIRGWEATANSPRIAGRAQFHLAYSHQYAQWSGGITGGLITDDSCEDTLCFLDHDQRNTLSTGFNLALPWHAWTDFSVNYGSGFLNGEGPEHLPRHTTYDLSLGKSFGESWTVRLTGLNLANNRYLLDNSNTFGGTHYVNPLELSVQIRYRFHF